MRILFAILSAALLPGPAAAQDSLVDRWNEDRTQVFDASEINMDDLRWVARPIIVFGESEFDPQLQRQLELLIAEAERLAERDVIIIVDTDPDVRSDLRTRFRPRSFMLALVGKDGQIKLRKPAPWDVREVSRSIDKMPLRQQEIRDRRELTE